MDIDYIIKESFQSYGTIISVGGLGYNKLKDQDQDIFICDALTHEFIHSLLGDMFDPITTSLFDCIGDKLLDIRILKRASSLNPGDKLWSDAIKENGIQFVYNEYLIGGNDLIQSYLICNSRLKEDECND